MARWTEADLTRSSAPKKPTDIRVSSAPPESQEAPQIEQIDALPAPTTGAIRWQQASGLHEEQFGGRFRLVVVGPAGRAQEVTDLLKSLPQSNQQQS